MLSVLHYRSDLPTARKTLCNKIEQCGIVHATPAAPTRSRADARVTDMNIPYWPGHTHQEWEDSDQEIIVVVVGVFSQHFSLAQAISWIGP